MVKFKVSAFAAAAATTVLFFVLALTAGVAVTEGKVLRSNTPFTDDIISTETDAVLVDATATLFAVAVLIMFGVVVDVVFMGLIANVALPYKIDYGL